MSGAHLRSFENNYCLTNIFVSVFPFIDCVRIQYRPGGSEPTQIFMFVACGGLKSSSDLPNTSPESVSSTDIYA